MRLTLKKIAAAVVEARDNIATCEMVRAPEGYFYAVGEYANGKPYVSGGVYVFRLNVGWSLRDWVNQMAEVIEEVNY